MRGIKFFGLAIALLGVSSCQDDVIEKTGTPVQTGDEIMFGSDLSSSSVQTRTIYGDPTGWQDVNKRYPTSYPVNWEDGDEIMIFCPQASQPANKRVNYRVTPSTTDASVAARVDKIEDIGLQWGEGIGKLGTHRFYGIYPASAVEGTAEETEQGKIHLSIPELQPVFKWVITQNNDGTITYNGIPNTDNAYMYAYAEVNKNDMSTSNAVYLKFKPLTTVLDFIVNGPESTDETINVTNLTVTAQDENTAPILTGNFICNISSGGGETITVEDDGSTGYSRSTISVPLYINADDNVEVSEGLNPADFKGKPIALKNGDMVRVRTFFLRSNDASVPKNTLQVAVSQVGTAPKRKKLQTADIVATEINMVDLPYMEKGGTNFWMSSVPANTYASELSIPGSKISFATPAMASNDLYYQTQSIERQFHDGVRAFTVQVQEAAKEAEGIGGLWGLTEYADYMNSVVEVKSGYNTQVKIVEELSSTLATIHNALEELRTEYEAKYGNDDNFREFAFIQLSWCGDGYSGSSANGWLGHLVDYINNNLVGVDNPYNIYTEEITPTTTLDDLAGSIVLKANTNAQWRMNKLPETSAPILFSDWRSETFYGDALYDPALRWGTKENTGMQWFAQEITACGTDGSWEDKQAQAKIVFTESVNLYNSNNNGTWFMNDLGGYISDGTYSGQARVTHLTQELNSMAVEELQKRTQNASLGLVLMNFADMQENSGKTYQSDWLIQTIIDNNFKFELRMKGDTSAGASYNAKYTSGGNAIGWDK